MATAEVWVTNLLGAVSYGVGAYVAVKYVLPLLNGFLQDIVKYKRAVDSFVRLLEILVYITAATGIIAKLTEIGDKAVGYVSVASPALEVLNGLFFPTLKLLVIGAGILLVVERIKLK